MQSLIVFGNKVEGRDKVMKFLQYSARFLRTAVKDKATLARLNGLFSAAGDARKMFRLAKSLNEYETITKLLNNPGLDTVATILQLLARSSFFIYWIFDNLTILSKIKVLKFEAKSWSRPGMTCWFIGILFSLLLLIRNLLGSFAQESALRSFAKTPETNEKIDKLLAARKILYLNILKNLGDLMPAATGSEIPQRLIGRGFPERWCGLGGMLSSAISVYQTWQ